MLAFNLMDRQDWIQYCSKPKQLFPSKYSSAFKLKIIELFNNGKSQISIANQLNINKPIVSRLIKSIKLMRK